MSSLIFDTTLITYKGNAPLIRFTVKNEDGTPTNLTGVTSPLLCYKKPNSSTVSTKVVTITDAANGLASVRLDATDTNVVGTIQAEFRVTFSGNPITLTVFAIEVRQSVCL